MDSPYRLAARPVEARWRSYEEIVAVGAIGLALSLIILWMQTIVTLSCDRAAGLCRLDTRSHFKSSSETIALSDFTEVYTVQVPGRDNHEQPTMESEVFVVIKGISRQLPHGGLEIDRLHFARRTDDFLRWPGPPSPLRVEYGRYPGFGIVNIGFPLGSAALFLAMLFVFPRVRIIGDPATGRLVFERRPIGPLLVFRTEFALDSVVGAKVEGSLRPCVHLILKMGGMVMLGSWAGGTTVSQFRDRIDGVLAAARGLTGVTDRSAIRSR